eukprot:PITA_15790
MFKILPEEEVVKEEEEEEISEARGADTLKEKSLIFISYVAIEMDNMMHPHPSCLGIELNKKEINPKVKPMTKRKKGPPEWLTKTLENVRPDEVAKTRARNSTRQNGDDVNDSDSPVDMDVSYDCEPNLSSNFEPTSFKEVASHDEWKEVMQKEYDALIKNGTWNLVDPPLGTKPIGYKWVYKNKYKADGSLEKHKARLVAKGFAQKEGVDYEETFAPTTK